MCIDHDIIFYVPWHHEIRVLKFKLFLQYNILPLIPFNTLSPITYIINNM